MLVDIHDRGTLAISDDLPAGMVPGGLGIEFARIFRSEIEELFSPGGVPCAVRARTHLRSVPSD